jgi:hypothetical protein
MENLKFASEQDLKHFYLAQGYFAIHYCDTFPGETEIDHYNLLKSGELIAPDCLDSNIISLDDEMALLIIRRFLYTGQVIIHPRHFTI